MSLFAETRRSLLLLTGLSVLSPYESGEKNAGVQHAEPLWYFEMGRRANNYSTVTIDLSALKRSSISSDLRFL